MTRPASIPRVWHPPCQPAHALGWSALHHTCYLDLNVPCSLWALLTRLPRSLITTTSAGRLYHACETKDGTFTVHARNRNCPGLVGLGNLRHGNRGNTLSRSLLLQCSLSVDVGRGTRDAGWRAPRPAQGACSRPRWCCYDVISRPYRYERHPCLSDPCQRPARQSARGSLEHPGYVPRLWPVQEERMSRRFEIDLRHLCTRNLLASEDLARHTETQHLPNFFSSYFPLAPLL